MIRIIFIACAFFLVTTIHAQLTKVSHLEQIRNSKMIIALSDDEWLNKDLCAAVGEFWTLCDVIDTLPRDEAFERTKANKELILIEIGSSYTISRPVSDEVIFNTRYITKEMRKGVTVQIMGSSKSKPVTRVHIPTFGEEEFIEKEIVYFGVAQLESMLRSMEEKGYSSNLKMRMMYNQNSAGDIAGMTLLLPEIWLDENLTEEKIGEVYPWPVKLASYEEWRDAILERKEGFVYVMLAPYPTAQAYVYPFFYVDCKSGRVKAVYWPAFTGVRVGSTRFDTQSAYITEDILGKTVDIIESDRK